MKSLAWQTALLCVALLGALCLWALPDIFLGSTVVFALAWAALMMALHRRCLAYLRRSSQHDNAKHS